MASGTVGFLKLLWAASAAMLVAHGTAIAEPLRNGFDLAGALVPVEEILQGRPLVATTLFWFAWAAFHPETAVYRAPRAKTGK